jgi:hypothetical protein
MKSIFFVSTATHHMNGQQFRSLVNNAAMNNAVKSVTGLLGYNGMNFIQLAEGPADAVDECIHRILNDDRHAGVRFFREKPITQRECQEWGIASGSLYVNPLRPETLATSWQCAGLTHDTKRILSSFASFGAG